MKNQLTTTKINQKTGWHFLAWPMLFAAFLLAVEFLVAGAPAVTKVYAQSSVTNLVLYSLFSGLVTVILPVTALGLIAGKANDFAMNRELEKDIRTGAYMWLCILGALCCILMFCFFYFSLFVGNSVIGRELKGGAAGVVIEIFENMIHIDKTSFGEYFDRRWINLLAGTLIFGMYALRYVNPECYDSISSETEEKKKEESKNKDSKDK